MAWIKKKDLVWEKATPIPREEPCKWRKDIAGNVISYDHYGKKKNESLYGWEIDHIYPRSLGGSDDIENLQPLQSNLNNTCSAKIQDKPGMTRAILKRESKPKKTYNIRIRSLKPVKTHAMKLTHKHAKKWNDFTPHQKQMFEKHFGHLSGKEKLKKFGVIGRAYSNDY